jgi:type I restriction enzyme S subunit
MSWEVKPLGELCEVVTKGTTPTTAGYRFQESGINFIKVESIGLSGELLPDMFSYVSEECHREQARSQLKENDILFSIAGALGRAALVGQDVLPANTNQALAIVRLREDAPLDHRFLLKLLASSIVTDQTAGMSGGAAQQNLSLAQVKDIKVPIPPLPEQQRIVGKVDAAFAALAEAQTHVERNRANARELFESYLNGAHAKHEQGWKQTTLGAEVKILTGYPFKSKQYTQSATDVKLLRGDNIVQGSLRWEDVKRWPADDTAEYDRYWMMEGDVVLAMDRTWVKAGLKYASLRKEDLPCLLVQRTACLRCGPNLDKQFLRFLIGSKDFTNYVISVQTGIGVPHISGGQISAFKFYIPSLAVQRQVSQTLTDLEAHTKQLETTYQQKLTELAGLKKAVLGAAFRGEL